MPKYIANVDLWLSHECRAVKAGDEFETTFPTIPGVGPMRLGESISEVLPKVLPEVKGKGHGKAKDDDIV